MTPKIRVGLIFGGKSGEHEVSLASAQSVARAIDHGKYDVILIGITKEGRWLAGENALKQLSAASASPLLKNANGNGAVGSTQLVPHADQNLDQLSPFASIDVAFPLVHGPFGEDGTIQGLLELADIPYVGAGVAASAVGMDKAMMKDIFRAHDLPIPEYLVILRQTWQLKPEETIHRIESELGYPCFVKPANLGSSVGVSKAHNWDELTQALTNAAKFDRKIIAERAIDAREIECSVLGNDEPSASLPGEVIPKNEFYDYAAKYDDSTGTELIVPADLPQDLTRAVKDLAIRAFRAVDCSGLARVDFLVERSTNKIFLNEINTIPGFTQVSMYPRMWEKSGVIYPTLIDRLIELALERYQDKKKNQTSMMKTDG